VHDSGGNTPPSWVQAFGAPVSPGFGLSGSAGMIGRASSPDTMGARILANDTGGIAIVNTSNFGGGFKRIVRDNSAYYVVSFYSSVPRDGAFHRVSVRVKSRPELEIRARAGYQAAPPDVKGKAMKPPKILSAAARDILSGISRTGDLPVEIFTSVYQVDGYDGSVLIGIHLPGSSLHLAQSDRIELSYAAIDRWGKMRAVERRAFVLTLNDAVRKGLRRQGSGSSDG